MNKLYLVLFFLIVFLSPLIVVAGDCPTYFDKYPLHKETIETWTSSNYGSMGERGFRCEYVKEYEEKITCDDLAMRLGCIPGTQTKYRQMEFVITYVANVESYIRYHERYPNSIYFCTGKHGWDDPNSDHYQDYNEVIGLQRYEHFDDKQGVIIRFSAHTKKDLLLDSSKVSSFINNLVNSLDSISCASLKASLESGRVITDYMISKGTGMAEGSYIEAEDKNQLQQSPGMGGWIKNFIFGKKKKHSSKLDPNLVEIYGEDEARKIQNNRDLLSKHKNKDDAPLEDMDETPKEKWSVGAFLRRFIFGKN